MSIKDVQPNDKLLSRKEAAEILGVKETTLATWHTTNRYPLPVIKVGKLAKYRMSDIHRFLEKRAVSHKTATFQTV